MRTCYLRNPLRLAAGLALAMGGAIGQTPPELAIRRATPVIDGDLAEWPKGGAIDLDQPAQLIEGKETWSGPGDLSASLRIAWDTNHLYLAGVVRDDQTSDDQNLAARDRVDCIELCLGFSVDAEGGSLRPEESPLFLMPLQSRRPWNWADTGKGGARQSGIQLTGVSVASRRLDAGSYQFEAAVPFHHFPGLRPGSETIGFNLVLHDFDGEASRPAVLAWNGRDPTAPKGLGLLRLPAPGPLVSASRRAPLLSDELISDLPYLLVPLTTLVGLVFLLRGWSRFRGRARWLHHGLVGGGVCLFAAGLWLPGLLTGWRADDQRQRLDHDLTTLQHILGQLEQGTLASYRGKSRDRALMDLLAGKSIARQRYTSYRSLAQLVPEQFGPPLRRFDDLPVRPYWLPLQAERTENFQFEPPLRGTKLHLVVGRPFAPSFSFMGRADGAPRLRLELDFGGGDKRTKDIDLDRPFADGASLGRDFWEVSVVPIVLARELRALSVGAERGVDLRLVGLSLEGAQPGQIEPLLLGTPSQDGVLTDLRGPYPQDAGIELAPGATAKVDIPANAGPAPEKLWFFYRAVYPGLPIANPGARVAELVLHFADGSQKRIELEHQVSMFYELAVYNTRDDPPPGSPAAIALSWIDETQEKHLNLGYPVTDLPEAALASIEFRNLAEYRIRFRSVVFGNERAAAPQDPPDSPLEREGQERRLRASERALLQSAGITIYRGGHRSETTLAPEQEMDVAALPRAVTGTEVTATEALLQDGSRRVVLFTPLTGDGWDGAVLSVESTDREWSSGQQASSRLGFLLCLISTPFLLVLLSELILVATNLRFRLMAVMSVAALLPLGLLSWMLVSVLEGGHTADVEEGMLGTVRSAMGQLVDQKAKVQSSAQQWLKDLQGLALGRLQSVPEAKLEEAAPAVGDELQKLLSGQLPPEWRGGFLRLEWQPGRAKTAAPPIVGMAGDERFASGEVPARSEPGVFMQWGVLMLGVRAEQKTDCGSFVLTAGRPLDGNLLGALAPGHLVLLTDVRGYPLAASAGRPEADLLLGQALDPPVMAQRELALATAAELRKPVVARASSSKGHYVYGSEVLRDLQDTPRGVLVVAQQDQRATLDLAFGRVPVRAFFLLVAGSLVVLAAFLSFVVSGRISRPIEQLEHGALALSRGKLETRVAVEEGGQIGRLTRTFNEMAADLQGRLQDLQALNRTMRELAAEHDEATTLDVLRRFCASHTAADAIRIVLADPAAQHLGVHAGRDHEPSFLPLGSLQLVQLTGPFSTVSRRGALPPPWCDILPSCRSATGLPIVFAGHARGVVLLGFERVEPLPVDLELLSTVVAQAAVAFERAQLQRFAVHDHVTGAFTPEYFRRHVVDEVSLAQQRGRPLSMVAVALGDGDRRPRGLRRFAALLRERLPRNAVLCHAGSGQFQAVLPAMTRAQAEKCLDDIGTAWADLVQKLPENEVEDRRPAGVVVQFPDEAPSAEFLFEALRARLLALHTPGASAMESDESLHRAGVTAVSPAMRAVYNTLRRVAPTDLPILLEGETGVGKEVLTNLVHRWSRRAGGPLVKVHCASLSETLLASELFGHEKGAFTGAERRKIGRFEQADGGTLFLDEVGEIPLDVQVKLLRVLQEGEVDRVGGTEPVDVDVRVIAATNRDIARMVAEGRFREDLYYRLQGLVVRVPPLRERKQELSDLVEHFRREVVDSGQSNARSLSTDAMDELYRQEWPGNIRELRNTVFRAMVMARGDLVHARDVLAALSTSPAAPAGAQVQAPEAAPSPTAPGTAPSTAAPPAPAAPAAVPAAGPVPAPLSVADAPPAEPPAPSTPYVLPRIAPEVEPGPLTEATLPPRLRELLARVRERSSYSTQDQMKATLVSHRTALRDLQALVRAGLIERVGTRRGAFYRPAAVDGRMSAGGQ
ncbi:MAG TPA: sigma 54-interacting transcriptional regulator [Planctomycetota bacterium]|nr:sigma 54-interacting transcriptional regulator [Planctomycetota bacterium]